MIEKENFINIQGWMLTELGLHGKELMTYAIIYGFSQDGSGWFFGGRKYIADWLGCNEKTAGSLLSSMTEKGFLIREEAITNNGKAYRYQAVALGAKNALTSGENEPTRGEKRPTLGAKNAHITIKGDLKEDNKERIGRFTPPSRDEVQAYADEKGYTWMDVDRFMAYYESNGWMVGKNKMRSWRAAVTNWALRDKPSSKEPAAPPKTERICPQCGERVLYRNIQMGRWECSGCLYSEK